MKTRLHKLICILTAAVMAAGLLSLPVHTALADTFVPLPGGTVKASSLTEAMYEIKGDTTINMDTDLVLTAIIGDYSLTLVGDGSISLYPLSTAGLSVKNLTVNCDLYVSALTGCSAVECTGTYTQNGGEAELYSVDQDAVFADKIIINDGTLIADTGNIGLSANSSLTVTKGVLDINTKWGALSSLGNMALSGGRISATAKEAEAVYCAGNLTLGGARLYASGKETAILADGEIDITGGLVDAEASKSAIRSISSTIEIDDPMYIDFPGGARAGYSGSTWQIKDADGKPVPQVLIKELQVNEFVYGRLRASGKTRYETAIASAEYLKVERGLDEFGCIIVASGSNYPDALSGAYLAAMNTAPILLAGSRPEEQTPVIEYIDQNLAPDGTVYILGGSGAVSTEVENALKAVVPHVERLYGKDRYETNLAILKKAGKKAVLPLLVADANGFADALSASALGMPILLINKSTGRLTDVQKNYLRSISLSNAYLIGGSGAVPDSFEDELKSVKSGLFVDRIGGKTRYETSIKIAEEFFGARELIAIATGSNFPDGLSGGPLAFAMDAPLILTLNDSSVYGQTKEYVTKNKVTRMVVFGGTGVFPEDFVSMFVGGAG